LDLWQIKTLCKNLILVFAWSEQFFWLPLEKKDQLCTGVLEVRFECDCAGFLLSPKQSGVGPHRARGLTEGIRLQVRHRERSGAICLSFS
jgi:hypothetical protein